jgi:intracellular septation protein A
MKLGLLNLLNDLLSTLVFIAVSLITGNDTLAIVLGIATGIIQFLWAWLRGKKIDAMQWLSLVLVVVFGGLALITQDIRFMMVKPSLIYIAIGAVMLRRGWMDRYLPQIAHDNLSPATIDLAGYAWAALMFAIAFGNLAVVWTCSFAVWSLYISIVPLAAKAAAMVVQYATFRTLVVRKIRSRRFAFVAAE